MMDYSLQAFLHHGVLQDPDVQANIIISFSQKPRELFFTPTLPRPNPNVQGHLVLMKVILSINIQELINTFPILYHA